MRHVPIAEFKNKVSEIFAAVEAGEEITVTRHGREVVKLVGVTQDRRARQRAAFEAAYALGREMKAKYGPTTAEEIRGWIDEGRP